MEDNDPVGYKSTKGEAAKEELGIQAITYPRHSPDLNPLDFHVWNAVEKKMMAGMKEPMNNRNTANPRRSFA